MLNSSFLTRLPKDTSLPVHAEYLVSPSLITNAGIVPEKQPGYVHYIASQVVEECTLIDAFGEVAETNDHVYNYARVLCHYDTLVLQFRDAVAEGDGEDVFRCWRVLLPHFLASRRTKYSLEALRLQFQARAILSTLTCSLDPVGLLC